MNRFEINNFLRSEYGIGLDPRRPTCPMYLQGHCPRGSTCRAKHFIRPIFTSRSYGIPVCKHWINGLCMKGDNCKFLHEFNLRKMPECNRFSRKGTCGNGSDCLYRHVDPLSKIPRCPRFDNGFCELGPRCSRRHVREPDICKFYLAGLCPNGCIAGDGPEGSVRRCNLGAHPRWADPKRLPLPTRRWQADASKLQVAPQAGDENKAGRRRWVGGSQAGLTNNTASKRSYVKRWGPY